MATTSLVYEEVGFNADNIAKKKLPEFLEDHGHLGFSKEQLTEIHKLATEAVKAAPKEEKKANVVVTHTDETGEIIPPKEEEQK